MTKRPSDLDDWSSDSEALFGSAKTDHAPSAADRERVRQALARKVAGVGGAPAPGSAAALEGATRTGVAGTALSGLVKVGLAVVLVAAGVLAVLRTGDSAKRADPASTDTADDSREPAQSPTPAGPAALDGARTPAEAVASNQPAAVRTPRSARERAPEGARSARAPAEETPAVEAASRAPAADFGARDDATATGSIARAASDSTNARAASRESDVAKAARTSADARAPLAARSPAPARTLERAAAGPAPDLSDARAELMLVQKIHAALRRAEPAAALSLCAQHARRWPHGAFEQEREGLRAIAACQAPGSAPDARARAGAYFATYPQGPLVPRVREACASQLAPPAPKPKL